MRTLHGKSLALSLVLTALLPQTLTYADDYIINQNQTGIALPGVTMPNGYDEVRAADGTVCRSALGGSGAYVDSGIIGGGLNSNNSNSLSAYGRVVVPLGRKPTRLDCDRLYQLELQRLELEVQMLQRGLDPRLNDSGGSDDDWAAEGWTTEGRTEAAPSASP